MAPLAKMFKDMGWQVTGSDQEAVFPPITTYLEDNKINFTKGYNPKNIKNRPDLVVVGRSSLLVNRENPEIAKAKELNCKIISFPEIVRDFLVKENSIVVAGTYGKTTSSALVSWILENGKLNPSFLIGGLPLNFSDGVKNTDSSYSVVEGDETPAMSETDPSKFMYFKPKFVLLTSAKWDHPEIFKSEGEYLEAYKNFLELIPSGGLLVACKEGDNLESLARYVKCKVVWYSSDSEADFFLKDINFEKDSTECVVSTPKGDLRLRTNLLGKHNLQNLCGAVALCQSLDIKNEIIQEATSTFKGVRERLEDMGTFGGVRVFLDFAQHPVKVKESLAALRTRFEKNKITCVFNPHASALQKKESLGWYGNAFEKADKVIVTKVNLSGSKDERVAGPDIVKAVSLSNKNVIYEPVGQKITKYLASCSEKDDIIVFMSSGGLQSQELINETIEGLKRK